MGMEMRKQRRGTQAATQARKQIQVDEDSDPTPEYSVIPREISKEKARYGSDETSLLLLADISSCILLLISQRMLEPLSMLGWELDLGYSLDHWFQVEE